MGGIVFGPHRHERIAFCGKLGGARLGRLKEGLGGSNKNTAPGKKRKNGRGECVFGPHRRERIAFLAENGQAWLRRSKAGPKRSKPVHLSERVLKTIKKWMDGSVFGPHRRKRIVFLLKFGDARHGPLKKGLGRSKKQHFR